MGFRGLGEGHVGEVLHDVTAGDPFAHSIQQACSVGPQQHGALRSIIGKLAVHPRCQGTDIPGADVLRFDEGSSFLLCGEELPHAPASNVEAAHLVADGTVDDLADDAQRLLALASESQLATKGRLSYTSCLNLLFHATGLR